MLISSKFLNDAMKNYKEGKENYHHPEDNNYPKHKDTQSMISLIYFIIAVLVFVAELILLVYLLMGALKCTQPGPERILHILLIVFFTYPYALLTAFFGNKCNMDVLRRGAQ